MRGWRRCSSATVRAGLPDVAAKPDDRGAYGPRLGARQPDLAQRGAAAKGMGQRRRCRKQGKACDRAKNREISAVRPCLQTRGAVPVFAAPLEPAISPGSRCNRAPSARPKAVLRGDEGHCDPAPAPDEDGAVCLHRLVVTNFPGSRLHGLPNGLRRAGETTTKCQPPQRSDGRSLNRGTARYSQTAYCGYTSPPPPRLGRHCPRRHGTRVVRWR